MELFTQWRATTSHCSPQAARAIDLEDRTVISKLIFIWYRKTNTFFPSKYQLDIQVFITLYFHTHTPQVDTPQFYANCWWAFHFPSYKDVHFHKWITLSHKSLLSTFPAMLHKTLYKYNNSGLMVPLANRDTPSYLALRPRRKFNPLALFTRSWGPPFESKIWQTDRKN